MAEGAPLDQHWRDILARRWLIVLTAALAGVFAYGISRVITPIYESRTIFYLATNEPAPVFMGAQPDGAPEPLFPIPDEKSAALNVGILRGREMIDALAAATGADAGEIRKRLDVVVSGEFMVEAFVRDPDPRRAARIANEVPSLYASFHEGSMRERVDARVDSLGSHVTALQGELDAVRARRAELREALGATPGTDAMARFAEARAQAEGRLATTMAEIEETEARAASLEESLSRERELYGSLGAMSTTPASDAMLEQLLALRVELAGATDGPQSPRRVAIEDQIHEVEAAIGAEQARLASAEAKTAGSLYEDLRGQLASARARLSGLRAMEAVFRTQADEATLRIAEAQTTIDDGEMLSSQIVRLEAQLDTAATNLAAAKMQAAGVRAPLVVVERAVESTRPSFPIPLLNTVVAVLTGALLGIYYALFLGHAERVRQRRGESAELPVFTAEELSQVRSLQIGGAARG